MVPCYLIPFSDQLILLALFACAVLNWNWILAHKVARRRRKEGTAGHRPRRQRTTFSAAQTLRLELEYQRSEYVTRGRRCEMADQLELSETQIKIWFQNRRAKDKRIEKAQLDQHYRKLLGCTNGGALTCSDPACCFRVLSNVSTENYQQLTHDVGFLLQDDERNQAYSEIDKHLIVQNENQCNDHGQRTTPMDEKSNNPRI